jgi:hypothetical protein
MLRRKRNSLTSGNCTLRDEKEPMVFWAKRWSALGGEELDEWQLYVEGRESLVPQRTIATRPAVPLPTQHSQTILLKKEDLL